MRLSLLIISGILVSACAIEGGPLFPPEQCEDGDGGAKTVTTTPTNDDGCVDYHLAIAGYPQPSRCPLAAEQCNYDTAINNSMTVPICCPYGQGCEAPADACVKMFSGPEWGYCCRPECEW